MAPGDSTRAGPRADELHELIVGLVAPVGTDLEDVETLLGEQVGKFGYQKNGIRLSDLLAEEATRARHRVELRTDDEFARLCSYMDAGNALRRVSSNDILARYAALRILRARSSDDQGNPKPLSGRLHVLRSLKHPDEVEALRKTYGDGFYLLAVHSPERVRMQNLEKRKHLDPSHIRTLIERDTHEAEKFGQRTRETFELGDVFIEHRGDKGQLLRDLERVVELLFGSPYVTPTRDEHAMFMAYAASLRSASLSRQVGATIASPGGDIVATGANDVPCYPGGQYWPEAGDTRDYVKKADSNDVEKRELAVRLLRGILGAAVSDLEDSALFERHEAALKASGILDITEYGRDVHAEMEAIASCARNGRSTRGCLLYTTTFPCHNCAKHIVASGISSVCFVEPYPKSRAMDLHDDAIELSDVTDTATRDNESARQVKVRFRPFVGVGPRRYFDLFSLKLGSGRPVTRKRAGQVRDFDDWANRGPRVPLLPSSYLERERLVTDTVADDVLTTGESQ